MIDQNNKPYIQYMRLDTLVRAPRNPKSHDLGTLHQSLSRFGFTNPAMLDERTGKLVAGHGRLDTLIQLKASGKKPPNRINVDENGNWLIPVIRGVSFADDGEAEAYLLADNQITMLGDWNDATLAQTLSDLAAQGEHMLDGIGWDLDDLDALLAKLGNQLDDDNNQNENNPDQQLNEEQLDALLNKYGVKLGQIWQVNEHFISCDDSTDPKTWHNLFAASGYHKIQGVFTSPPYAEQRSKKGDWYGGIPQDQYVDWWDNVQSNINNYLSPGSSLLLNIKPNVVDGSRVLYVFDLVLAMCRNWHWHLIDEFCWERLSAPGTWPNRFKNGFEPVYQFSKDTRIAFYREAVAMEGSGYSVHSGNKSTGNYYNTSNKTVEWDQVLPSNRIPSFGNAMGSGHPAAFPVGLPEFFMLAFSQPDTTWADPFSGSGTVAVAAHKNGRNALLIENQPKYVAATLERLAILTNDSPVLVTATDKVGE